MNNPKLHTALTVTTYERFNEFVKAWARGKIQLLLLIGDPGVSKSQTVRRALKGETCWIEGQASAVAMYCELYKHKHKPVVIDDVDALYANDASRRLLKSLCQTDKEKEVSWRTQNRTLQDAGIPTSFVTRSRVCIIANEWKTLNTDVKAIEDRAITVIFKPTPLEVHLHASTWFDDQESFDYMASILHLIRTPSLRHYLACKSFRTGGFKNWRQLTIERVCESELVPVAQIISDPQYTTDKERCVAYKAAGHGSESSYWRYKKKLPTPVAAPAIKLRLSKSQAPRKATIPFRKAK